MLSCNIINSILEAFTSITTVSRNLAFVAKSGSKFSKKIRAFSIFYFCVHQNGPATTERTLKKPFKSNHKTLQRTVLEAYSEIHSLIHLSIVSEPEIVALSDNIITNRTDSLRIDWLLFFSQSGVQGLCIY